MNQRNIMENRFQDKVKMVIISIARSIMIIMCIWISIEYFKVHENGLLSECKNHYIFLKEILLMVMFAIMSFCFKNKALVIVIFCVVSFFIFNSLRNDISFLWVGLGS